jgi:hypothetical protein
MGNAQIPRRAERAAEEYGIDRDGKRIQMLLFQHTPRGHAEPMWWIVQYRCTQSGGVAKGSRVSRRYSGRTAAPRARHDWCVSAEMLRRSRGVTDLPTAPAALRDNR